MALIGNTIRLTGKFVDFDGDVVTATDVKYIIYDKDGTIAEVEVASPNANNEYVANYIVPAGNGLLYAKLSGLVDSYPELGIITIIRE